MLTIISRDTEVFTPTLAIIFQLSDVWSGTRPNAFIPVKIHRERDILCYLHIPRIKDKKAAAVGRGG